MEKTMFDLDFEEKALIKKIRGLGYGRKENPNRMLQKRALFGSHREMGREVSEHR